MSKNIYKKSFTLIEMLIVVVIIGILAAALIPRIQNIQGRARDTQRKVDIRQIGDALNLYYIDKGKYENARDTIPDLGSWETSLEPIYRLNYLVPGYLTSVPRDPLNKQGGINLSDKSNKSYIYAWYFYHSSYCPEYIKRFGVLGVLNFEATKPGTNINKCSNHNWHWFDYSPGLLVEGQYKGQVVRQ